MSEVNNQSSAPSMSQIMAEANKAMGKLTMLGATEGQLSEGLTDTQTQVAENYKGYIESYNSKTDVFTKFSVGAAVVVAVGGAATGIGSVATQVATPSLVSEGMQVAATGVEAGLHVGQGVTGLDQGKAQSKEEVSSSTLQVTGSNASSASSSVQDIMDTVKNGKESVTSMIKNQGQASTYQG